MPETGSAGWVDIAIFGSLQAFRLEQGLPVKLREKVPAEGLSAYELLERISLPPEKVEAVFRNGRVINIYDTVFPDDRVAFFPFGTPGPYRVFLGMARENVRRSRQEHSAPAKDEPA